MARLSHGFRPALIVLWANVLWASAARAHDPAQSMKVGSLELERCGSTPLTYCGTLERPLDPSGALPDRIGIHFELYPHLAEGPATGTLVATEGGPGYPATESRAEYLALFTPLRAHRDVIIMDNRGTGRSGALDCPQLQASDHWTVELVGACGKQLGPRAALYGTAYAADDLAAILTALGRSSIDLYGDSYGTFFEQVFALRHPEMLKRIVLDGAYPIDGSDYAWYPSYAPAMRSKYELVCARSPGCAVRGGGGIEHLRPLLEALRRAPYEASARDADGKERHFRADAAQLATVMFASSPAIASVRELDAASRAFLVGDRLPLERLMAETLSGVDSRDPTGNPQHWSAALEAAVQCKDAPQIYDMSLATPERAFARDRAIAERERIAPNTYAPFTIEEFRHMPLDYSFLDLCVAWPEASAAHPAGAPVSPAARYPDVPALVISGELDDITTVADGAAVAHAFRHGHQVVIANSFHVNALPRARSTCGSMLVRRFLAAPSDTAAGGDDSTASGACAAAVPPIRLLDAFAMRAAELEPAHALAGNRAGPAALQAVSGALLTVADVLCRVPSNSAGHGPGLRGGGFRVRLAGDSVTVWLREVRFTADLGISGVIELHGAHHPAVRARVHVAGPDVTGGLTMRWQEGSSAPTARIEGTLGGERVQAQAPAP